MGSPWTVDLQHVMDMRSSAIVVLGTLLSLGLMTPIQLEPLVCWPPYIFLVLGLIHTSHLQPGPIRYAKTGNVLIEVDDCVFLVKQQLNDGIRMLQMQAHNANGTIRLCHSSCVSHFSEFVTVIVLNYVSVAVWWRYLGGLPKNRYASLWFNLATTNILQLRHG